MNYITKRFSEVDSINFTFDDRNYSVKRFSEIELTDDVKDLIEQGLITEEDAIEDAKNARKVQSFDDSYFNQNQYGFVKGVKDTFRNAFNVNKRIKDSTRQIIHNSKEAKTVGKNINVLSKAQQNKNINPAAFEKMLVKNRAKLDKKVADNAKRIIKDSKIARAKLGKAALATAGAAAVAYGGKKLYDKYKKKRAHSYDDQYYDQNQQGTTKEILKKGWNTAGKVLGPALGVAGTIGTAAEVAAQLKTQKAINKLNKKLDEHGIPR